MTREEVFQNKNKIVEHNGVLCRDVTWKYIHPKAKSCARVLEPINNDVKLLCKSFDSKTKKCLKGYNLNCDNCNHFRTH